MKYIMRCYCRRSYRCCLCGILQIVTDVKPYFSLICDEENQHDKIWMTFMNIFIRCDKNNLDSFCYIVTPHNQLKSITWGEFLCGNGSSTTNASLLGFAQCFMIDEGNPHAISKTRKWPLVRYHAPSIRN